ncbi:MAG: helix-turn-helix domain-containing protein [Dehalococcoidia bacterium]
MVAKIEQTSFDLLGKRWSALIVQDLIRGPRRFRELLASLGRINDKVLSQRLKELAVRGIIDRKVFAEVPVRVEYTLTSRGTALVEVIQAMENWDADWANGSGKATRKNGAAAAAGKESAGPAAEAHKAPEVSQPVAEPAVAEPEKEPKPSSSIGAELEKLVREEVKAGKTAGGAEPRVPFWKRLGL